MSNCWLKVFSLKNGCTFLASDPLRLDTAPLGGKAGLFVWLGFYSCLRVWGWERTPGSNGKEEGMLLKQCQGVPGCTCSVGGKGTHWTGKSTRWKRCSAENEQNPKDYVRVQTLRQHIRIAVREKECREGMGWQIHHFVQCSFNLEGRKDGRKEREKRKKALTISASLDQPRSFVLHLTSCSWYYENISVWGKISYKDHLLLAVPLFAIGILMHLETKTVAILGTRCCSLRAGVTWGKAVSSPRRDCGLSHGEYGKMTSCPTGNIFSLLSKFKLLFPAKESKWRTHLPSLLSGWVRDTLKREMQINREELRYQSTSDYTISWVINNSSGCFCRMLDEK